MYTDEGEWLRELQMSENILKCFLYASELHLLLLLLLLLLVSMHENTTYYTFSKECMILIMSFS